MLKYDISITKPRRKISTFLDVSFKLFITKMFQINQQYIQVSCNEKFTHKLILPRISRTICEFHALREIHARVATLINVLSLKYVSNIIILI